MGSGPVAGNPRQVSRTFKGSKKRGDSTLAALVASTVTGNAPIGASSTLVEFLDRVTPTRSPTTIRGYKFKIQRIDARPC
jgi:hypothetical protein